MVFKKNKRKEASNNSSSHQVRIIGGLWKRTPLSVKDVEGLRPTSERVRETLFNWLVHLRGNSFNELRCLDCFAGTGALGFEAASRGVAHVTMIEENRFAFFNLEVSQKKLGALQMTILHADAFKMIQQLIQSNQRFDLIFLDPPFQENLLPEILPLCVKLLTENGLIYVESNKPLLEEKLTQLVSDQLNLQIVRDNKAGQVYYHLLEMKA